MKASGPCEEPGVWNVHFPTPEDILPMALTNHLMVMFVFLSFSSATTTQSPFLNFTDAQIRTALIPWDWNIHPNSTNPHKCPDAPHTLGMFAAINIVGALVSLAIGHRHFAHYIICRFLARTESKLWFLAVLPQVGFQVGSSFLNAFLISKVPGYSHVPVRKLALLFLARPRLTWIPLMALLNTKAYKNTAMATIVTETILQFLGAYTMGRTAHFAAVHGYYPSGHHNFLHGADAHLMYSGALVFLVFMYASIMGVVYACGAYYDLDLGFDDMEKGERPAFLVSNGILFLCLTWIGSWLFWAGFIKLAGNLFCLPSLAETGTIFALFSVFGTFAGAALS